MNQRVLGEGPTVYTRQRAHPVAGGTIEKHPHSWPLEHLAVTVPDTGCLPIERYLDGTPASPARLSTWASHSGGQPAMLLPCAHLGSPGAGAWNTPESAAELDRPATAFASHLTRVHPISALQLPAPQPLSPPPAPFERTPFLGSTPSPSWHGPPPARHRIPLDDSVFLRGQLPLSEPPLRCLVFERLCEKQMLAHRCRFVRLADLLAVLKHLVNEHMDACCPICYRELLQVKNLEIGHFKKGPAFFEKIQYTIAHIRCKHTKPWYCRVCNLRFGTKRNYNVHMQKYPAHNSIERAAIAGYYDGKTQASDEKLGKCTNKADLDDWDMLGCLAQSRASPNGGFRLQLDPRGTYALPPRPAFPSVSRQQPSQIDGYAGSQSFGSFQHAPICQNQNVAHA